MIDLVAARHPTMAERFGHPDTSDRLIKIRAADTEGHRSSANVLVERMYGWRGYETAPGFFDEEPHPDRLTLIASEHDETVGTITVGFDGEDGLLVEESFAEEVARLRDQDIVLCEFIKFAMDHVVRSKKVLASLMHAALLCARETGGCDVVLIEVNPRHVRFYREMLGFSVLDARERQNLRVNAPAVLMALELHFADRQISAAHSAPAVSNGQAHDRSLYRYGFSSEEVAGVTQRLRGAAASREKMRYKN